MERSDTWDYYPLGKKDTQRNRNVKLVELTNIKEEKEMRPTTFKLG